MAQNTHTVKVIGVMKKTGQMAKYGEEVSKDDFEDFQDKIDGGYLQPKADFDRDREAEQGGKGGKADKSPEELEEIKQQKEAADALKKRNQLLAKYEKTFSVDAPADATNEAIDEAIKNKKAL